MFYSTPILISRFKLGSLGVGDLVIQTRKVAQFAQTQSELLNYSCAIAFNCQTVRLLICPLLKNISAAVSSNRNSQKPQDSLKTRCLKELVDKVNQKSACKGDNEVEEPSTADLTGSRLKVSVEYCRLKVNVVYCRLKVSIE